MSVEDFLVAASAEIARLSASKDPADIDRRRAIDTIVSSYSPNARPRDNIRTLAREAWLRANYATWPGMKSDVLAAVNALPGNPMTMSEMSNWICKLDLKRGREVLAIVRRRSTPRNRDGSFALAAAADQDIQDALTECPMTLDDALEWGRRNGMKIGGSIAENLRATNAIRAANGLPAFTIVADKMQGPLPRLLRAQAGSAT